jgi:hypothetical protein
MTSKGEVLMALITSAKPLKKRSPSAAVVIPASSSKEAPAQKTFSPALRKQDEFDLGIFTRFGNSFSQLGQQGTR